MKRIIAISLFVLLCLGLTACGEKNNNSTSSDKTSSGNMGSSVVSGVESGISSITSKVESTVSDIGSQMMSSK